jgi:eukaryotic-like serine/threonine-protein kinase
MYCTVCGAANEAGNSVCTVCEHPIEEDSGKTGDESFLNGRYRILTQVGTGGFGAVYKARDTLSAGRRTAIIAIKQVNLRGLTPQEIIEATDGFHREVLLLSTLEHVNLPHIYDSFTDPEHWYLVMDFIEGETLEQYLRNTTSGSSPATTRSLPLDEVFSMALQLCHVLHYLHTRQPPIIFRDLKPANVMRAPEGILYLIDFGIARQFKPGQAKDTMPFGSPGYAAPEQYGKAQTTPQSDLYSLGALLHQLLSGEDPAETPFRFAPLRLYGTAGLAELEALIMRMVDMDPGNRPASTAEVKEELRRIVMVRRLRTQEEPRLWRPGQPQDLPSEFPPAPWQAITPGSGQQQQQVHVPQAGPSRRKVLLGGLVAGAALVAGTEGLLWLLRSSGPRPMPPAPVLKAVPTQQIVPTQQATPTPQPTQQQVAPTPQPTQHQAAQVIYRGHARGVSSVTWSPDSQFIASASRDDTVQVWEAMSGKHVFTYKITGAWAVAWSPHNQIIAIVDTVVGGGVVQGWNPFLGHGGHSFTYPVDTEGTWCVAWSPDGTHIATGSYSGMQILNVANGQVVFKHDRYAAQVRTVTWSPDGRSIAWESSDYQTVDVWEVAMNRRAYVYYGPIKDDATAIAWSPDGTYLAFGSAGTVQVWETARWSHVYTFAWPAQMVNAVAWSPDSKRIASAGSLDPTAQVWNAVDGRNAFTYRGHSDPVWTVAWSPDGKRIASGSDDKTVQVWQAP